MKTENEILKRRLAAAETWAAQAVITKRLDTLAANRLDALAAERARPWWRRLAGLSAGGPGSLHRRAFVNRYRSVLISATETLQGRVESTLPNRHHQRLASYPSERCALSFQGERLGRVSAMLPSVAVPSRSGSAGAMHPADRVAPNRRRSAL